MKFEFGCAKKLPALRQASGKIQICTTPRNIMLGPFFILQTLADCDFECPSYACKLLLFVILNASKDDYLLVQCKLVLQ